MRIPRDLSGQDLCELLGRDGYAITHQTGSHIRLTTRQNGEHHITIPDHNPIRIGTLNTIPISVANHLRLAKGDLITELFV